MWNWIKAHKGPIGLVVTALWGAAQALGPDVVPPGVLEVFDKVAPFLLGAGFLKSDSYHRDRQPTVVK